MILGVLGLLLFGYLFVLSIKTFFRKLVPVLRAMRRGAQADGVIHGITTQVVGSGNSEHRLKRPIVTFTDSRGLKVKYTETMTRPGSGMTGEHVTVRYDPSNPEHTATIATWTDMRRQLVLGGVVFLVLIFMCATAVLLITGTWKA